MATKAKVMTEREKKIQAIDQERVRVYFKENKDMTKLCGEPIIRETDGKRRVYVEIPSCMVDYQIKTSGGNLTLEDPTADAPEKVGPAPEVKAKHDNSSKAGDKLKDAVSKGY